MRLAVLYDRSGNMESIAILSSDFQGTVHVETEGGGRVREVEVEEGAVDPAALLGRRGLDAEEAVYDKLRRILEAP